MIKLYGIYEVTCEFQFDHNCWEQEIVQIDLEKGETGDQAMKFVSNRGWELDGQVMCPYCANQITREEYEGLSLVSEDE